MQRTMRMNCCFGAEGTPGCLIAAGLFTVLLLLVFPGSSTAGTVSVEAVTAAVETAVRERVETKGLDVEIVVPHAREVEIEGCDYPEVRAKLAVRKVRGISAPVRVEFRGPGGDLLKRVHFVAQVRTFAEAVTVLRDIPRGDTLRAEDVAVERVEVSGMGDYYTDPRDIAGVCARNTIRTGNILHAGLVKPIPVVDRGDRVTIRAVVGGVELVAEGIARQDGGRGELIRVYNEMTRNSVRCRILDAKTVLVLNEGE